MSRDTLLAWWFRAAMVVRTRAVGGALLLAVTALAATATGCASSGTAAAVPVPPQPASTERFEAFVKEVGIDLAEVPAAVRGEWASAPQIIIDDCGIPGAHEPHGHGSSQ